jgi:hypothetical protein
MTKVFVNVLSPPSPLVSAKGDGVTDDTVALQNIITSHEGKIIIIPYTNSFYLLSAQLDLPSNTHLIIDGTIKLANGANCHMLNLGTGTNFTIEGMGILDGNMVNQTNPLDNAKGAIVSGNVLTYGGAGASNIRIRNITIQNVQYWPFNLVNSNDIIIENVKAITFVSSANVSKCHDFEIKGCLIEGSTIDMGLVAYGGCYNGKIHDNTSTGNHDVGINIFDDIYSAGVCHDIEVYNNFTNTNGNVGIGIQSNDNGSQHYNIKIHDNISKNDNLVGPTGNGFGTLTYSKDCEIYNNTIVEHNGIVALLLNGERINAHDNTIINCGHTTSNGWALGLGGDGTKGGAYWVSNNKVIDNQIIPTTKYPLALIGADGTVYSDIIINNNNFTTNLVSGGTPIYNPGTWTYKAYNNEGYKTENQGIGSIESAAWTVAINHSLVSIPKNITFAIAGNVTNAWVASSDSASFTIQFAAAAPSALGIYWSANTY